jgi:hypothetical protein
MAGSPIRRVPRFSSDKPLNEPLNLNEAKPARSAVQPSGARWKSLLLDMLNETNQAKRELAALALEEAIYERHQELTELRSYDADSMVERLKMKDAFMRLLDVKSQLCFTDRAPVPLEFRHVPRSAPDWGASEAEAADWRTLLLRLLGENDHAKLARLAANLEDAIFVRYRQLSNLESRDAVEERRELQLACDRLTLVRINVLGERNGKKAG